MLSRTASALALAVGCLSAQLSPSATGFTFLKIGVGARPVAMGGAFTAVADDANALFWNPAGLAMASDFSVNLTMMNLVQSVSYTAAGLLTPLGRGLTIGAAGGLLSATDTRRDELGRETGTFGVSDFAAGPGLAWRPFSGLGVGLAGRYVAGRIDSFTAYALSADGGVIYRPVRYFTAGVSLLHLGPPRRFLTAWEYPPLNLRSGVALNVPLGEGHVLLASDLSLYPDLPPQMSVGGEAYVRLQGAGGSQAGTRDQGLALRAGYISGFHLGTWSGFSFGIGYDYAIARGLFLGVDVVYVSYGLLGDSQRASLYLRFAPKGR